MLIIRCGSPREHVEWVAELGALLQFRAEIKDPLIGLLIACTFIRRKTAKER